MARYERHIFNEKYVHYWSDAIMNNAGDPRALWSKVSALLRAPSRSLSTSTRSADDFANYFKDKVDRIRAATSSAPRPIIEQRSCAALSGLRVVTTGEITKISEHRHQSIAHLIQHQPGW